MTKEELLAALINASDDRERASIIEDLWSNHKILETDRPALEPHLYSADLGVREEAIIALVVESKFDGYTVEVLATLFLALLVSNDQLSNICEAQLQIWRSAAIQWQRERLRR